MLFEVSEKPAPGNIIPATVDFKIDKKKRRMRVLSPEEKMLCALRKVLTNMSDKDVNKCRYFIDNNQVQLIKRPVSNGGREGEAKNYTASGRCKIGVCHPGGHKSSMMIEFKIAFRDTKNDLGLDDVEYLDGTTIDTLPANTVIR